MAKEGELLARLSSLEARFQALEDEQAIRSLLVRYGFNADLGRLDAYLANWVDDCEYEQGVGRVLRGKPELATIMAPDGGAHKRHLENRSQHMIANVVVQVMGDTAWAEGYSFVLYRSEGGYQIWSCACNQWDFRREAGGWKIARRRRRAIGDDGSGGDVIHRYLADQGEAGEIDVG